MLIDIKLLLIVNIKPKKLSPLRPCQPRHKQGLFPFRIKMSYKIIVNQIVVIVPHKASQDLEASRQGCIGDMLKNFSMAGGARSSMSTAMNAPNQDIIEAARPIMDQKGSICSGTNTTR